MTTLLEGNELRRAVAEALGWRVKAVDESDVGIINPEVRFVGYTPNGERFVQFTDDLDAAWALFFLWADIPDYANDLNTIKDAPLPDDMVIDCFSPFTKDKAKRWGVMIRTEYSRVGSYSASHPEPATAFWNAWLKIRKAARDG